jgi:hypothetical protein
MTSRCEKHILRFPAGGPADDEHTSHLQGPQTLADIALVARESAYQVVLTARCAPLSALVIASSPPQEPFLATRQPYNGQPLLLSGLPLMWAAPSAGSLSRGPRPPWPRVGAMATRSAGHDAGAARVYPLVFLLMSCFDVYYFLITTSHYLGRHLCLPFAQGCARQGDLVRIVHQPVEDRVGQRRILDDFIVPPSSMACAVAHGGQNLLTPRVVPR